jgi:hypothetical protein
MRRRTPADEHPLAPTADPDNKRQKEARQKGGQGFREKAL